MIDTVLFCRQGQTEPNLPLLFDIRAAFISLQIIRPLPAKSCDNFHEVLRQNQLLRHISIFFQLCESLSLFLTNNFLSLFIFTYFRL